MLLISRKIVYYTFDIIPHIKLIWRTIGNQIYFHVFLFLETKEYCCDLWVIPQHGLKLDIYLREKNEIFQNNKYV